MAKSSLIPDYRRKRPAKGGRGKRILMGAFRIGLGIMVFTWVWVLAYRFVPVPVTATMLFGVVLVGICLREVRDRAVERLARTKVARDRRRVA